MRILVTGAASGIGAALAAHLLTQGHDVVAVDRADYDLADPAAVDKLLADVGPVDGLANVAGVPGTAPADLVLRVNFLAARRIAQALAARMAPGGSVVNVASLAARRPGVDDATADRLCAAPDADVLAFAAAEGLDGSAAYDLSKKLLVAHTTVLSAESQASGVRVCSVSPGPIETPIIGDFRTSMGASVDAAAELVGRHGTAAEVAAVVAFLLSAEASWVNGIDLPVDGGLIALRTVASRGASA
jgi:NAD(P)-dependent dehydrogenase (short-subunit alcohol dehydrogenase family)